MNKNIDWFSLISGYLLFAFIYSGVAWLVWEFLFAPMFFINFSYLQILGIYTITRLFFGNTNTNYVSNFYSQKPIELDKMDTYLQDLEDRLNREQDELDKGYKSLTKKEYKDLDKEDK